MRLLEQTRTDEVTPLLYAEQFLLDALGRHPRRADDDERRLGALAPAMEQPRSDFLADPCRPHDHHPAAG